MSLMDLCLRRWYHCTATQTAATAMARFWSRPMVQRKTVEGRRHLCLWEEKNEPQRCSIYGLGADKRRRTVHRLSQGWQVKITERKKRRCGKMNLTWNAARRTSNPRTRRNRMVEAACDKLVPDQPIFSYSATKRLPTLSISADSPPPMQGTENPRAACPPPSAPKNSILSRTTLEHFGSPLRLTVLAGPVPGT